LVQPSPYRQVSEELRLTGSHPSLFGWGHEVNFVGGLYFFNSAFDTSDNFAIENLGAAAAYEAAAQTQQHPLPIIPGSAIGSLAGQLAPILGTILAAPNSLPLGINTNQSAMVNLDQHQRSYAVFGQMEHFFTAEWGWIGGLRLGLERKQGDASSFSNSPLIPLISAQSNFTESVDRSEHDISPKLGIKWSPSKTAGAYATWSRGYKSGGFNGLPLNNTNLEYGPERASSYEIGAKARLFDGTMHVSAAVYSTNFENLQISSFQNNSFVILNAASARSQGFEADLRWLPPIDGVEINSTAGLSNAHYVSYPNAPAPGDSAQSSQDLSGRPLAFAPRWSGSLIPSYTYNLDSYAAAATFAVDLLYRGQQYLDVDDDNRKVQPATTIVNLRTALGNPGHNWSFVLAAHNITNRLVLDQVVDQPLAPGNFASVRTDYGRYYSANLSLAF
ncbi:MAG: TonB-dependent receptor, partial [Stenotrophobium sp.]